MLKSADFEKSMHGFAMDSRTRVIQTVFFLKKKTGDIFLILFESWKLREFLGNCCCTFLVVFCFFPGFFPLPWLNTISRHLPCALKQSHSRRCMHLELTLAAKQIAAKIKPQIHVLLCSGRSFHRGYSMYRTVLNYDVSLCPQRFSTVVLKDMRCSCRPTFTILHLLPILTISPCTFLLRAYI